MSRQTRGDEPDFVEIAVVASDDTLRVLRVTRDALPVARARGWMVWEDVVRAATSVTAPQGDGDGGDGL